MKNKINLYIFSAVLLYNCADTSKIEDRILSINPDNTTGFNLDSVASFHSMIALETTETSLIKKIRQVVIVDTCLIVWDDDMKNILVFDNKGKYLYPIGIKGKGPQEYLETTNIFVNQKDKTISILDNGKRSIITYHLSGKFVSSDPLPFYAYAYYPASDGYWLLNLAQNPGKYNILLLDKSKKEIIKGFLPGNIASILIPSNNFINSAGNIYFHYPNEDRIYKIEGSKLKSCLYVDFGKKKNPYRNVSSEKYHKFIEQEKYVGNIQNLYIHGDKLFFSFWERLGNNRLKSYHVFASLTNDFEPVIFNYKINFGNNVGISPLPEILGLSDNKLIYQINPNILDDRLINALKESRGLEESAYKEEITSDSNPVLVMYQLRN
jgi:hypothetical protein